MSSQIILVLEHFVIEKTSQQSLIFLTITYYFNNHLVARYRLEPLSYRLSLRCNTDPSIAATEAECIVHCHQRISQGCGARNGRAGHNLFITLAGSFFIDSMLRLLDDNIVPLITLIEIGAKIFFAPILVNFFWHTFQMIVRKKLS